MVALARRARRARAARAARAASASSSRRCTGRIARNGTASTAFSRSSGTRAPSSIRARLRHRSAASTGRKEPTTSSAPRAPSVRDERRGDQRAEREPAHDHALEHAEDARGDRGRRRPLQQRHRRDVDERVPHADDAERDHGGEGHRDGADHHERRAPEDDPEREVAGEPSAPDERERDAGADDRADAARRLEQADARVADVEQVERGHDHEHAEGAGHEALCAVEADQEPQPRLGADRAHAGAEPFVIALGRRPRRAFRERARARRMRRSRRTSPRRGRTPRRSC